MNFQLEDTASGVVVRITGELNFASNAEFKSIIDRLGAIKGKVIVFDLANVSHIDSVGLGLLYIAKEEAEATGNKIRLKAPQSSVMKMLHLTEAESDFEILG